MRSDEAEEDVRDRLDLFGWREAETSDQGGYDFCSDRLEEDREGDEGAGEDGGDRGGASGVGDDRVEEEVGGEQVWRGGGEGQEGL